MNHGSNLTLLEMDSKNRSEQMIARARRTRRQQIIGPQTGEETSLHQNRIVRFSRLHSLELTAAAAATVVFVGGIVSAVALA